MSSGLAHPIGADRAAEVSHRCSRHICSLVAVSPRFCMVHAIGLWQYLGKEALHQALHTLSASLSGSSSTVEPLSCPTPIPCASRLLRWPYGRREGDLCPSASRRDPASLWCHRCRSACLHQGLRVGRAVACRSTRHWPHCDHKCSRLPRRVRVAQGAGRSVLGFRPAQVIIANMSWGIGGGKGCVASGREQMSRKRCQRCFRRPSRRLQCPVCNFSVGVGCCWDDSRGCCFSCFREPEPEPSLDDEKITEGMQDTYRDSRLRQIRDDLAVVDPGLTPRGLPESVDLRARLVFTAASEDEAPIEKTKDVSPRNTSTNFVVTPEDDSLNELCHVCDMILGMAIRCSDCNRAVHVLCQNQCPVCRSNVCIPCQRWHDHLDSADAPPWRTIHFGTRLHGCASCTTPL